MLPGVKFGGSVLPGVKFSNDFSRAFSRAGVGVYVQGKGCCHSYSNIHEVGVVCSPASNSGVVCSPASNSLMISRALSRARAWACTCKERVAVTPMLPGVKFSNDFSRAFSRAGGRALGQYVGMTVRDTGVGIPKNALSSGLGLAQLFGFAKQHGAGVATIETRVGNGISTNVFLTSRRNRASNVFQFHLS